MLISNVGSLSDTLSDMSSWYDSQLFDVIFSFFVVFGVGEKVSMRGIVPLLALREQKIFLLQAGLTAFQNLLVGFII